MTIIGLAETVYYRTRSRVAFRKSKPSFLRDYRSVVQGRLNMVRRTLVSREEAT
jgi:hypothetical protein